MNRRPWSGLLLSVIVLAAALLPAANNSDTIDQPWPALLSPEPADINPDFAVLQHRANVALARLVEATHTVQ